MHVIVTGAAGFIGSHLCERLLSEGHSVIGIDCFTDYYARDRKVASLHSCREHQDFQLHEVDLAMADLSPIFEGAEVVFHLAGQPGVRDSWGRGFDSYVHHNVIGTQRVLEQMLRSEVSRIVYASSSSVYGERAKARSTESDVPAPFSPYGITKLAAEHLVRAYGENHGINGYCLRYFTVYGPRQRPDMAFHRLIRAAKEGEEFPMFGDGSQVRDFTYIDDVVRATASAGFCAADGVEIVNIAGGSQATLLECIAIVEASVGRPIRLALQGRASGDVSRTNASTEAARQLLGWLPSVPLAKGLARYAQCGP